MDKFMVSVKGVLVFEDKLLLRKNERLEYEPLGGRLEKTDLTPRDRVKTEFIEESGIAINVTEPLEPWLYEIGLKNIVIVPYVCSAKSIPDVLYDEDGGELHWIGREEIAALFMPQGYKDSIDGTIPHKSYSIPVYKYFRVIPNYVERDYYVKLRVFEGGKSIAEEYLPHFNTPRDFIHVLLGEEYRNCEFRSRETSTNMDIDTLYIDYDLIQK